MSRPPLQPRASSSNYPRASLPRMILAPLIRLVRRLAPPGLPTSLPSLPSLSSTLQPSSSSTSVPIILLVTGALQRLDLSRDPRKTLHRLSKHHFTITNTLPYVFFSSIALYCLYVMRLPILFRLAIPTLYILAVLLPITSQLIWPATPVLTWVILFFTARFIPSSHRPEIHVALLPALESVLYGANISDLQTRYTNAVMDIIAWLPYGVAHFSLPVIVALILWAIGPKGAAQYWGKAFGWMNLLGVMTQILFPCAAPWYEIIHGLTPADYSMPGSPGGLLRIDRVLHTSTYTNAFGSAPLVFGAFPSLHSGCAVMEALFMSHFYPRFKPLYWMYVGVLWWATMYLSHHYLIDLTAGACLSVIVFYVTMPAEFKDVDQIIWTREQGGVGAPVLYATTNGPIDPPSGSGQIVASGSGSGSTSGAREDDVHGPSGLEGMEHREARKSQTFDERLERLEREEDDEAEGDEESRIGAMGSNRSPKKPKRTVSWGETKVLGEDNGGSSEDREGDGG